MRKFLNSNVNIVLSILLLLGIAFSVIKIVMAVAPNPGHNFTEVSGSVAQGDLLYGSAADVLSALAKNITATRYLSNTGATNNPAWAQVDLTNGVTGILPTANGGTGIAFFTAAGPTVARVYTFPDAAATVLTTNAAVTVAQGGTGLGTLTLNNVILGNGTASPLFVAPGTSGNVLTSNGTTWTSAAAAGGNDGRITMDALTTGEQFDVTANSVALTEAVNLSQTLAAGTYTFKYHVIWRTNDATNGIRLAVNYTGTNGAFVWWWRWTDVSATASTAAPDQDAIIAAGQVMGSHASRAKSSLTRGALISADTVNADMMVIIEGVFVATGTGDLELWAGNETAGAGDFVSLMIGTSVEIHKTK